MFGRSQIHSFALFWFSLDHSSNDDHPRFGGFCNSFVIAPSLSWKQRSIKNRLWSNNDNSPMIEFSDFGEDFWAGSNNDDGTLSYSPSSSSSLSNSNPKWKDMAKEFQQEKEKKLSENWQRGNWNVRGFSLDRYNARSMDNSLLMEDNANKTTSATQSTIIPTTTVSKIALGMDIVVGRTDGSVVLVELGTEYWTKFESKLSIVETSNLTVAIESQLVRANDDIEAIGDSNNNRPGVSATASVQEIPFEVIHQFTAHEGSEISALLWTENDDTDEAIVVTADVAGHMTVWSVPDAPGERVFPLRNLVAHSNRIVALKPVRLANNLLLFSASIDGTLALWDMWTGDVVYRCQMEEPTGASIQILSVDAAADRIFLGLNTGHVVSYLVSEMIQAASVGDACPIPNGRFLAHQEGAGGVTALACSPDATSIITGGAEGTVKQWDILTRTNPNGTTMLDQWPRLSNQRMKQRAHLFRGHDDRISALQYHPNAILSASVDGTVRAWNYQTGKELFVMDGFSENINSLCLAEDTLVTNGMNQFVCVHDFNVDAESEVEAGIDLDW